MYKPIYDKSSASKRVAEIFTWLLLLFLLPTTAFGYLAEGSIPGQPLYPVKLAIEHTALMLQFLSPQAQASYQVGLVNKRFDEVQTLLTKDTSTGEDFSNFGTQLEDATKYIVSLPDSPEKTLLKEKLLTNIQTYQQQLQDQQQIIENKQQIERIQTLENYQNPKVNNQQQNPTPPPPPNFNNNFNNNSQPLPTPTPSQPGSSPADSNSVDSALNDMQYQLNQSSYDLNNNNVQNTDTNQSPSSTPTETLTATPWPSSIAPTQEPTPTPTQGPSYNATLCTNLGNRCVTDKIYCNGTVYWNYSYPYSCSAQVPVCCPNIPTPTPTPYHQNNNNNSNYHSQY